MMTPEEAVSDIVATEPGFALEIVNIRGVQYPVFKNIPPHMMALLNAGRTAHDCANSDYLIFGEESWSYEAFLINVNQVADVLSSRFDVIKGTPVAVAARNCPEYIVLFMAISALGAVTVFLNARWTTAELQYALEDSHARLIFADATRCQRLQPLVGSLNLRLIGVRDGESLSEYRYSDLLEHADKTSSPDAVIDTDDDLAIMYSSGTTGIPKGVVLTHRGALNAVYTWLMQFAIDLRTNPPAPDAPAPPRPAMLIATPLFHVTATHPLFLLSIPAGAKVVLMDKWDAFEAAKIIDSEKITRFMGVPTQSADLMHAATVLGTSLQSLDYLGSGGAKRPPAQVGELSRTFPVARIATGWGMTETNANGIGFAGDDYLQRPTSAGRLYPPLQELRFVDKDDNDVPPGEIGEITVKSACNMRCYLNKPVETAQVLKDGWLRTGDLGYIDQQGYVTIVDRLKNIIIRGGENIACLDVEAALHRHAAVREACAFSVPNDRFGEVVGAVVRTEYGQTVTDRELIRFLTGRIADFKIPEHIWVRSTPLPRGATEKIDRRALRQQCLAALAQSESHI